MNDLGVVFMFIVNTILLLYLAWVVESLIKKVEKLEGKDYEK